MSIDAQLQEAAGGGELAGRAVPEDWWRSRTAEELREFINRGFAGGDLFTGATAEAARRFDEAQRTAKEQAAATSRQRRWKSRKILILRIAVGLSLVATLFTTVIVISHLGE